MDVVLIGGGARSGKSRFALDYAEKRFERPAFVATAQALDEEMAERIRRHQAERGPRWKTIEEPLEIVPAMRREAAQTDVFVVDCLTLWLSNLLAAGRDPEAETADLLGYLREDGRPAAVLITNEVGCGIVPENALARRFRDLAGGLNQAVARVSSEVYWMVFSMPVALHALAGKRSSGRG